MLSVFGQLFRSVQTRIDEIFVVLCSPSRFCACLECIFIIAHTKSRRRAEDNKYLINVTAYHSHHSWPFYFIPLLPTPVRMWPPRRSQQWGVIDYNPCMILSKDTTGEEPKSICMSINLFTLIKIPSRCPIWNYNHHSCLKSKIKYPSVLFPKYIAPSHNWSRTSSPI